jgi:hypothetical protein
MTRPVGRFSPTAISCRAALRKPDARAKSRREPRGARAGPPVPLSEGLLRRRRRGPRGFRQHTDLTSSYFRIRRRCLVPRRSPRRGFPADWRAALPKIPGITRCEGSIRSLKSNKSKRISAISAIHGGPLRRPAAADAPEPRLKPCLGGCFWPCHRPRGFQNGGPPALAKAPTLLPTYLPMDLPTNVVIGKTPDLAISAEFGARAVPPEPFRRLLNRFEKPDLGGTNGPEAVNLGSLGGKSLKFIGQPH